MSKDSPAQPIVVGTEVIAPGARSRFDLPAARLPTHTKLNIPLTVINGRKKGPVVWLSAAVHGDELNGVEIIRQVMDGIEGGLVRGAIIAVPIVNVFGFIGQSRYLPDRRDLNRSFPGSTKGSLASRMAQLFMAEIVSKCSHGIDLHTASQDKTNLPQIRANLDDPETLRCAQAFGAPVMVHSKERTGSLRAAAAKLGISVLVYEGGAAQRFNEDAITAGVRGVRSVLSELGIIPKSSRKRQPVVRVDASQWVRTRTGGILRLAVKQGEVVVPKQLIGRVSDPFGDDEVVLRAPFRGLVIGCTMNPVVHAGDAVVNLGQIRN
ncbi:MAG: succinylglutamate desuccinylase/aspartoacylase family protein [Planctomycetes bacterium]|nr:succinylglutamate desuccinylase/aspartoacylase family protein [Planctomycetota bacterium]